MDDQSRAGVSAELVDGAGDKREKSNCIAAACGRLVRLMNLDGPSARGRREEWTSKLTGVALKICEEEGVDEDEAPSVASAIDLLSSGLLKDRERDVVSQFPAALRLMVRLVHGSVVAKASAKAFLVDLEAAAARLREGAKTDECDEHEGVNEPKLEVVAARGVKSLEAPLMSQQEGAPADALMLSFWPEVEGESDAWHAPQAKDEINASRKLSHCRRAVVRQISTQEGSRYECEVELGEGPSKVSLRSGRSVRVAECLQEAVKLAGLCPDEDVSDWRAVLKRECPEHDWPERVEIRNVIDVGLPRFVCTACWSADGTEITRTTTRSTQRETVLELACRIKDDPKRAPKVKEQGGKLDPAKRFSEEGFGGAVVKWQGGAGAWSCSATWKRLDGSTASCTTGAYKEQWQVVERALELARCDERDYTMNWRQVADNMLRGSRSGQVIRVAFERVGSATDAERAGGLCCILTMSGKAEHLLRGPSRSTKKQALQAVVEQAKTHRAWGEDGARGVRIAVDAREGAKAIATALAEGRVGWLRRRQELLAKGERSEAERSELQDTNWLIALGEPGRSGEVPRADAERLLKRVLTGGGAIVATSVAMSAGDSVRVLKAMALSGVVRAGDLAGQTSEFRAECARLKTDPEQMVSELRDRKLLNVKSGDRVRFSAMAQSMVMRQSVGTGQRMASSLGDKLAAAMKSKEA